MDRRYGAALSLYGAFSGRKYLDDAERKRFVTALGGLSERERALCLTLYVTGCRLSEALALHRQAIDQTNRWVVIESKKKRRSGHMRIVPVPKSYLREISPFLAGLRTQDRLFPIGRTQGWRIVKKAMEIAKITGLQACPKGLRHSFGVHAIKSGIPLNLLQKWMGHANMETTAIYANVMGGEEYRIAMRMW